MLLTEWNTEDAIAFAREEGREEGWEKGRKEGREEGMEKGREEGISEERQSFLELINQGLSIEELKQHLSVQLPSS